MEVRYSQIIHVNCIFHYKPSIWGYPHLWNPPHVCKWAGPRVLLFFSWSLWRGQRLQQDFADFAKVRLVGDTAQKEQGWSCVLNNTFYGIFQGLYHVHIYISIISYHIISYIIYYIPYIIYHIPYTIYHISYIIYHISYIIYHMSFHISSVVDP